MHFWYQSQCFQVGLFCFCIQLMGGPNKKTSILSLCVWIFVCVSYCWASKEDEAHNGVVIFLRPQSYKGAAEMGFKQGSSASKKLIDFQIERGNWDQNIKLGENPICSSRQSNFGFQSFQSKCLVASTVVICYICHPTFILPSYGSPPHFSSRDPPPSLVLAHERVRPLQAPQPIRTVVVSRMGMWPNKPQ